MYSLLWSEHCAYKHSKQLLRTLPTEGAARRHGARRERRRRRRRRRPRLRLQGRVAQPPERRRAVPGRRDRRRRDPARHLRDRRAPDRRARLAALRRAGRLLGDAQRATCSTAPSPASATTATRSACRRSAARSTSRAPTSRTASSTRWRSASPTRERLVRSAAAGAGNLLVLFGASTGRDGIGGASVLASAELGAGDARQAPDRAGRRPVRGEEAARVLARAARARPARLAAGPRRRRARPPRPPRWPPRARSASTSTSRACRCASPAWSRSR